MPINHKVNFDLKKRCPDDPEARKRIPGCSDVKVKPFEPQNRHPPKPTPVRPTPVIPVPTPVIPVPDPKPTTGTLSSDQRVTFEIDCDNGFENTDSTMKGCYTIVNVD